MHLRTRYLFCHIKQQLHTMGLLLHRVDQVVLFIFLSNGIIYTDLFSVLFKLDNQRF